MTSRQPPENNEELAKALADLFEYTPVSEDQVDQDLREAGYDPDEFSARMKLVVDSAIEQSPLNWRNRGEEIEAARKRFAKIKASVPKPENLLEAILKLQQATRQAGVHYRNEDLRNMSDEDLESIYFQLLDLSNPDMD